MGFVGEKKLQVCAAKVLQALGRGPAALDIVLLADSEMKRMKWHWLRKKTEPNVLSFPEPKKFPHPETGKRFMGEIYLNRSILQKSPDRTIPLLVHGILHLVGYDHTKKSDAIRMERKERRIVLLLSRRKKPDRILNRSNRSSSRA